MRESSKSGQLILEILIAIGVTTMVLISLLAAVSKGVKNTDTAMQVSKASFYAKEGLEIARKARDQAEDWQDFLDTYTGSLAFAKNDALPSGVCPATTANVDNFFIRCLTFNHIEESGETNKVETIVRVSWSSSHCSGGSYCHQVQATTFLTNWER